jgi:hypothetical protein
MASRRWNMQEYYVLRTIFSRSVNLLLRITTHWVCNWIYARQFEPHWRSRHFGQNVTLFSRYITHQRRRFHTAPSPKTSISMQTESPSRPSHNIYRVFRRNIAVRVYRTSVLAYLSRLLLEKLTGSQIVKKFPSFYGIRRFIPAFKIVRHLSLSWARSIQSIPPPYPTSWRYILILPSYIILRLDRFPSRFPTKPLYVYTREKS